MTSGEDLVRGSAAEQLRAFLTSDESKLLTRSLDRGLAELVLQAIYLELHGGAKGVKLASVLDGTNYFRELQGKRVENISGLFRLPEKGRGK